MRSGSRPGSRCWHLRQIAFPLPRSSWTLLPANGSSEHRSRLPWRCERTAEAAGFEASAATSSNVYAAVVAARGFPGITIVPTGYEADVLAPLPLRVLELEPEQRETFASWGIRTLGQLAGLPQKALIARVGEVGRRLQALSRGDYDHLLTPVEPAADAVLSESTELEHPVDLLEPLLFLISRMLEQIVRRAAARALAIAQVETKLVLDGPIRRDAPREHRRIVRPALPEWSYQTLLKLVQLDLELHPPEAAVIALHLRGTTGTLADRAARIVHAANTRGWTIGNPAGTAAQTGRGGPRRRRRVAGQPSP